MTRAIQYTMADPTGNITLLVGTPVPRADQPACAARLIEREPAAEQVGFLSPGENADITLRMAGGEFCGNATMSAAVLRAADSGLAEGRLRVAASGTEEPVSVEVQALPDGTWRGAVSMPRPLSVMKEVLPDGKIYPVVRFDGIAHVILEQIPNRASAEALSPLWCRRLNAMALGLMFLDRENSTLTPLVYVPGAGTLFWENSCASGTAAIGALLASEAGGPVSASLRQPGGVLTVTAAADGELTLSGRVRLMARRTAELSI